MPAEPRVPKYCLHKPSGRAYMRIRGRVRYLGSHGSPESLEEYGRLIAELASSPIPSPTISSPSGLTVVELAAAYLDHAELYYRKGGEPTRTLDDIKRAIGLVTDLYGRTPATEFGPLALIAIQNQLAEKRLARGYINAQVRKVCQMFKWGVSRQLVPPGVYQALAAVDSLKKGRSAARETQPVKPVEDPIVEATLAHLPSVVADMVRFERLTGCRPGEVCHLRPMDVDRSHQVWAFWPASHKTEHHEHERVIFIGPKAQAILLSYLLRPAEAFCFSPAESVARRNAAMRARRKTKVQPSQVCRKKARPKRVPRDCYTRYSYNRAVQRACEIAFGMPKELRCIPKKLTDQERNRLKELAAEWRAEHCWSPNQLRHTAGTEIRRQYGLEAAQVVLGHAKADVTQIYAERDYALAADVARKIG